MKRIDASISPSALDGVRAVLQSLGVRSLVLRQAESLGRYPRRKGLCRGIPFEREAETQVEITAIVQDGDLANVLSAIQSSTNRGEIFVSSVDSVVRWGDSESQPNPGNQALREVDWKGSGQRMGARLFLTPGYLHGR